VKVQVLVAVFEGNIDPLVEFEGGVEPVVLVTLGRLANTMPDQDHAVEWQRDAGRVVRAGERPKLRAVRKGTEPWGTTSTAHGAGVYFLWPSGSMRWGRRRYNRQRFKQGWLRGYVGHRALLAVDWRGACDGAAGE
jgi:hypothetical protein